MAMLVSGRVPVFFFELVWVMVLGSHTWVFLFVHFLLQVVATQICFYVHPPLGGNDPIWRRISFKWVGSTTKTSSCFCCSVCLVPFLLTRHLHRYVSAALKPRCPKVKLNSRFEFPRRLDMSQFAPHAGPGKPRRRATAMAGWLYGGSLK